MASVAARMAYRLVDGCGVVGYGRRVVQQQPKHTCMYPYTPKKDPPPGARTDLAGELLRGLPAVEGVRVVCHQKGQVLLRLLREPQPHGRREAWFMGGRVVGWWFVGRGEGFEGRDYACIWMCAILFNHLYLHITTDRPTDHPQRGKKTHRGGWRERARSRRCRSKRSAPPASAPAPTKRVGGWLICFGRRYGLGGTVSGSPYVRVHP